MFHYSSNRVIFSTDSFHWVNYTFCLKWNQSGYAGPANSADLSGMKCMNGDQVRHTVSDMDCIRFSRPCRYDGAQGDSSAWPRELCRIDRSVVGRPPSFIYFLFFKISTKYKSYVFGQFFFFLTTYFLKNYHSKIRFFSKFH